MTAADGSYGLFSTRAATMGELQEVPWGATDATQQPQMIAGAPQVVPDTDLHPRDAWVRMALQMMEQCVERPVHSQVSGQTEE